MLLISLNATFDCQNIIKFGDYLQTFEKIVLAKMANWHNFLKALKSTKNKNFVW
jgi:hypothetical protein